MEKDFTNSELTSTAATVSIVDRIRHLMSVLKINQAELARRIDINPSNLSKYLSGRLPVNDSLINRIVAKLGVSLQWLRDGDDVPFPRNHQLPVIDDNKPVKLQPAVEGVPVYDIDVTAGCLQLSRMLTEDRIRGYVNLPQLDTDCIIVGVSGDSMEPVLRNGGFVSIRPITNMRNIFWGRIYVVVMDDYRMVKYLRRNDDPTKITLRSANPNYDDMEVDRSDIQGLFLVEAIIHCELQS
ncbi:MAG: XRE family transcriptional regulator [Muribaculaceae bacterium]|nr:XRE family transcriptional regulator [Muribaculaceae bacterium]MDE6320946.1 XRE family transcriptional regulator [Muribaculaceae bacterium]